MKKIGLLGGTFNPPHIGHLIMANEVKNALGLDEVRLMPTALPPHKASRNDATAAQRLRMVELAVEDVNGLVMFPFEVERGGISYTYDTMAALTANEPLTEFYFIIGGDMIDMLSDWYRIDDLMEMVTFVGVDRPHTIGKTTYTIQRVSIPQIDLSSTLLRGRFSEGQTVKFLMPEAVESYIREEGLYGCRQIGK